ncbi:MAG: YihY/virulence factor BrkB family protein [Rickettsiales bacterium]|nr:YihY/virulence factor BrkB family protein [Rickettsiales bacterium]
MKERAKKILKSFYDAGYYTIHHDGIEHAGYLAFLALLSLFPFIVFVFSIAGNLGKEEIGIRFIAEIRHFLPHDAIASLEPRINEILSGPPQGLLTLAIIGIIWTSSSIVEGLRTILNRAYRVNNPPRYIFRRLMSMLQIIILTFLVIIAMFFITIAPNLWDFIKDYFNLTFEIDPHLLRLRYYISAYVIFFSLAISYYVLPNIKQSLIAVLPGAFVVLILWLISAHIFSGYIEQYRQLNIVYGSLANFIITLIFFYVLSVIYIFGAEFNYFFEKSLGHEIIQKE